MLDHISLGTHDLARATAFYARVLATLGYQIQQQGAEESVFGPAQEWLFILYPADPGQPTAGARMHVALRAESRDAARAFEREALDCGAECIREVAERLQFGADYFGGVFRDLDGHAIEVLTRSA